MKQHGDQLREYVSTMRDIFLAPCEMSLETVSNFIVSPIEAERVAQHIILNSSSLRGAPGVSQIILTPGEPPALIREVVINPDQDTLTAYTGLDGVIMELLGIPEIVVPPKKSRFSLCYRSASPTRQIDFLFSVKQVSVKQKPANIFNGVVITNQQ